MFKRYRKWRDKTTVRVGRTMTDDPCRITFDRKGRIKGVEIWNAMPNGTWGYNVFMSEKDLKKYA